MQHTYDPATKTHTIVHSDQEVADYQAVNVDVFTRVDELVKSSNVSISNSAANIRYSAAIAIAKQLKDQSQVTAILAQTTQSLQAALDAQNAAPQN